MNLPNPDQNALAHSALLKKHIQKEITQAGGAISFARFMEMALYTPGLGYYSAGAHKLGVGGDFLTAPEISPFFARCIATQCESILANISSGDILEIGAGSGVLAKDVLIALKVRSALPRYYFILESSADLRERQQALLKKHCPDEFERVQWLDHLPAAETFNGVIIANEVLDALPVHAFRIEHQAVQERAVGWSDDHFIWQSRAPFSPELNEQVQPLIKDHALPDGYESEIHLFLTQWVQSIATCLRQGVMLFFDYGYGRSEYYHRDRSMGTLMCYYQHYKHADPFILVGLQDMTAHVDFTRVVESAAAVGCELMGYTTQAEFLLGCGLLEMAGKADVSQVEMFREMQAIKRLILPGEMGELVKVMALGKQCEMPLLGFSRGERRYGL